MTHAPTSAVSLRIAGTMQRSVLGVVSVTSHGCPPTVTALESPRCSNPPPLKVSREPPPAEPLEGETAAIVMAYSKATPAATSTSPSSGWRMATATVPRGPTPAVQVTWRELGWDQREGQGKGQIQGDQVC